MCRLASIHFGADRRTNGQTADSDVAISQLTSCVADVDVWMKANRLCLNAQKTQLIWLGSGQQLEKIAVTDVQLLSANLQVMSTVRDLGVVIDSRLTMADHITAVCRSAYYQLRQVRCVVQSLTPEAAMTLVHSFVSTRLDYGTVIPCCTALQIISTSDYSPCRTLQHDCLPVHEDRSTSRQCCNHCTGCLLISGLSTNLQH